MTLDGDRIRRFQWRRLAACGGWYEQGDACWDQSPQAKGLRHLTQRIGDGLPYDLRGGFATDVGRQIFGLGEDFLDAAFNGSGFGFAQMFQHHGARPDLSDGIGDPFSGDVRSGTVHRLEPRFAVDSCNLSSLKPPDGSKCKTGWGDPRIRQLQDSQGNCGWSALRPMAKDQGSQAWLPFHSTSQLESVNR